MSGNYSSPFAYLKKGVSSKAVFKNYILNVYFESDNNVFLIIS